MSSYFKKLKAEAEAIGRAEGVMVEKIASTRWHIRIVLGARGVTLSRSAAARLDKCADAEKLERWFLAAITATKASDLWTKR